MLRWGFRLSQKKQSKFQASKFQALFRILAKWIVTSVTSSEAHCGSQSHCSLPYHPDFTRLQEAVIWDGRTWTTLNPEPWTNFWLVTMKLQQYQKLCNNSVTLPSRKQAPPSALQPWFLCDCEEALSDGVSLWTKLMINSTRCVALRRERRQLWPPPPWSQVPFSSSFP